jgi:hypothetical protein
MAHDPWLQAVEQGSGIEGLHLKCSKGVWMLDDVIVETGPEGLKVIVLMETAQHGAILWKDGIPAERRLTAYSDKAPPERETLEPGWSVYTTAQCVIDDGPGQWATWTSSAWGGRRAFTRLIGQYVRMGRSAFPVCALGTKPQTNDGNVDPQFVVVGWRPREDFAAMLPPPPPAAPLLDAPAAAPALESPADRQAVPAGMKPRKPRAKAAGGKTIDDEIPW